MYHYDVNGLYPNAMKTNVSPTDIFALFVGDISVMLEYVNLFNTYKSFLIIITYILSFSLTTLVLDKFQFSGNIVIRFIQIFILTFIFNTNKNPEAAKVATGTGDVKDQDNVGTKGEDNNNDDVNQSG